MLLADIKNRHINICSKREISKRSERMNKRGVEAIGVVIALVLGLIIALLLIGILTGKIGTVNQATSCEGQGGKCDPAGDCKGALSISTTDCKLPSKCCVTS